MDISNYNFMYNGPEKNHYCEVDQITHMRWLPVRVDHANKEVHADVYPFQCREFLADWVFFGHTGCGGEIYGMSFDEMEWFEDQDYTTHILVLTPDPKEVDTLKHLSTPVTTLDLPELGSYDDWYEVENYEEDSLPQAEYIGIVEVPDYAQASPLGMLLWTMGLRWRVENKYTGDEYDDRPFGLPPSEKANGLAGDFLAVAGDQNVAKLYEKKDELLWRIDTDLEEMYISDVTHEGFSPVSVFKIASHETWAGMQMPNKGNNQLGAHHQIIPITEYIYA
jgi:hypothetical protein